jgi:nicotinate-nucleotide adenylyltransferase
MECLVPRVEVSEMEAERPGPSYTIDTLKILRQEKPGDKLFIMIGSDILQETRLWKSFDEIERMAELIILPRPVSEKNQSDNRSCSRFTLPDISSTEIRRMLKEGREAAPFVSRRVREYIRANHLYT